MNNIFEKAQSLFDKNDGQPQPQDVLRLAFSGGIGRLAVVSSFGAESAVLLHMVAQIDRQHPVIFIDTLMLFRETLDYQNRLADTLGLLNVISIGPDPDHLNLRDPDDRLHQTRPDACCHIRKTEPLDRALQGYDGWITGRKRFQNSSRMSLAIFERDGLRLKINPLAHYGPAQISDYMDRFNLPRHPLVNVGYKSIGCAPCTSPVRAGEDPRAGRWRGLDKSECGIHVVNGQMRPMDNAKVV